MGVGIKIIKSVVFFSMFLHKIICCERVLESPRRDDSNTRIRSIILWRLIITEIKKKKNKKKHWSLVKLCKYGDVHVMKIYGWYFKSHDDPQTHPLMIRSQSLYAHCSHRVRRGHAESTRNTLGVR